MPHDTHHESVTHVHMSGSMQQCIDACNECRDSCTAMVGHCLELGGRHAGGEHIGLLLDCAAICAASSGFMLRESKHHRTVCVACAEVCRTCAESCRSIGGDDDMMTRCAEVCQRCAESCERMAG